MSLWSAFLVLLGLSPAQAEPSLAAAAEPAPAVAEAHAAAPRNAGPWQATVTLEAARTEVVYAHLAGIVRRVAVGVGDSVAAGDTLALLHDQDLRLSAESAALARLRAERRWERARRLHGKGGISTQELEGLEYTAQTARIRWQQARLDLGRTVLTASMAGVVSECHVQVGVATTVRMHAFRIIDPSDLRAELFLPADRVGGLRRGQPVRARAPALPESLAGELVRLSPFVDPTSGTCRAVVLFRGAGDRLRPGSVVQVEVGRDRARATNSTEGTR